MVVLVERALRWGWPGDLARLRGVGVLAMLRLASELLPGDGGPDSRQVTGYRPWRGSEPPGEAWIVSWPRNSWDEDVTGSLVWFRLAGFCPWAWGVETVETR